MPHTILQKIDKKSKRCFSLLKDVRRCQKPSGTVSRSVWLENFWEHICSMYMLKKGKKNENFQSPKLNQWWQCSQNHPGHAHWTMKSRIEIRFGKHGSEGGGKKFFTHFFQVWTENEEKFQKSLTQSWITKKRLDISWKFFFPLAHCSMSMSWVILASLPSLV